MLRDRWDSPAVGTLVLVLMVLYTLPYLVVGVMGGGIALEKLTDGEVSYPLGAAFITGITLTYTSLGGMRGTAWTNVFQGLVFLAFLVAACIGIAGALGGASALYARVAEQAPQLLEPAFEPGEWATGFLIGPVSVIAFPHMFLRLMAARDSRALRRTIIIYPWALLVLFIPVTLIGVWGAVEVPGLEGKQSDGILPGLVASELPAWLGAVGLAAILAAVMSSLDGQLLTMSTLGSVDVLERRTRWTPRAVGRLFVVGLAVLAFLVALVRPEGIFNISKYAFSGYTLIIPVLIAAFFWRRSTATGVIVASLVSHPLLALYHAGDLVPALETGWVVPFGVLPVALCVVVELAVLFVVSLATAPPAASSVERFANPFGSPPTP